MKFRCPFIAFFIASWLSFYAAAASVPQKLPDFEWPVWPSESESVGTSHGPFPFWCDTSNSSKGAYKFTCLARTVHDFVSAERFSHNNTRRCIAMVWILIVGRGGSCPAGSGHAV